MESRQMKDYRFQAVKGEFDQGVLSTGNARNSREFLAGNSLNSVDMKKVVAKTRHRSSGQQASLYRRMTRPCIAARIFRERRISRHCNAAWICKTIPNSK
ncbi:hypothetical protein JTB14_031158 [Gonioctena quinquepunctata]|nr:hypothetical protein JTB14_031158 [Gonioctena quinquepunctata]